MHLDEQALLNGVIENPDEDTPRLVYADWLEEHGKAAQALFIRWKILGLAAIGVTGTTNHLLDRAINGEFAAIAKEARDAFATAAPEGCAGFFRRDNWLGISEHGFPRSGYSRGMLARVEVAGSELAPLASRLFRSAPIIEVSVMREARELLYCPELRRVRQLSLQLGCWMNDVPSLVEALLECSHLDHLNVLRIDAVQVLWDDYRAEGESIQLLSGEQWQRLRQRFGRRLNPRHQQHDW